MKIFILISAFLELEAHRKNHHQKNSQNFAVKNITGNHDLMVTDGHWWSPMAIFNRNWLIFIEIITLTALNLAEFGLFLGLNRN